MSRECNHISSRSIRCFVARIGGVLLSLTLILGSIPKVPGQPSLPLAERLRLTGRYEEAAEIYQTQVKSKPVAAVKGWARCQVAVGKTSDAERGLRQALETHPRSATLLAELARLLFERGEYDGAETLVKSSLSAEPNHAGARWLQAELHRVHGRLALARQSCAWLAGHYDQPASIDDPETLRWVGLATAQLARWTHDGAKYRFVVNSLCPSALRLDPNFWPAHLDAATLLLAKFNQPAATDALNAALVINSRAAEVHALRARLALQTYDLEQARAMIERALQINPKLLVAHQLKADLYLAGQQPGKALEVLETARELNPASEETLGRLAAAYATIDGWRSDDASSRLGQTILAANQRNPHCARFYASLAASLELQHRYPPAAMYYAEALERMPELADVRAQLGLMQMRLGDEPTAARLLRTSFRQDPFNTRVKNMLEVLDVLASYAVLETEHFIIKYDRDKDDILARHAADYLERTAYPELVAALGYEPSEKSLFEIFSRARNTSGHGWFSARMVGLPYLGTVAACAGKMVALTSPSDTRKGYNWARVLRHEFVHVINLQQTDFNIPHWFTEALAVRYEDCPRPRAWEQVLARRARAGTLLTLDTINGGFVRPSNHDDWTLAYCQAELYAEFMVQQYGEETLGKMLRAYADHLTTGDAVRTACGVSQRTLEEGYGRHIKRVIQDLSAGKPQPKAVAELRGQLEVEPDNADLRAELAHACYRREMYPESRKQAELALDNAPRHQLACYVMARLDLRAGDRQRALRRLAGCLDEAAPHRETLALLATLRRQSGDTAEAARLYQLGAQAFPRDDNWIDALARVCLDSGDNDRLAWALRQLAGQDADNGTVRKKLAQLALARGDHEAATHWAREALHVDVTDALTHAMLGQALTGMGRLPEVIHSYETALRLRPGHVPWQVTLATVAIEADSKDKARAVLDDVLERQPEHESARTLRQGLDQ